VYATKKDSLFVAYETRAIISLSDPEAAGLSIARALASHLQCHDRASKISFRQKGEKVDQRRPTHTRVIPLRGKFQTGGKNREPDNISWTRFILGCGLRPTSRRAERKCTIGAGRLSRFVRGSPRLLRPPLRAERTSRRPSREPQKAGAHRASLASSPRARCCAPRRISRDRHGAGRTNVSFPGARSVGGLSSPPDPGDSPR